MNKEVRIDTFQMESYYLEKYGKTSKRELTETEIKGMYGLLETFQENNLKLVFGLVPSCCAFCLFKNPENEWVVLDSCDLDEGYLYGTYTDFHEACTTLIKKDYEIKDRKGFMNSFEERLREEPSKIAIHKFIQKHQIEPITEPNKVLKK